MNDQMTREFVEGIVAAARANGTPPDAGCWMLEAAVAMHDAYAAENPNVVTDGRSVTDLCWLLVAGGRRRQVEGDPND